MLGMSTLELTHRIDIYSLPPGLLLTTEELAEILQIKENTLRGYRTNGRKSGPTYRRLAGNIRYRVSDVIEWIEEGDD